MPSPAALFARNFQRALVALLISTPVCAYAQGAGARLTELSLEELGNVMVDSVSKQPEELWRAPVAISVLTRDQIRRSGLTALPEVLRLVPGVEVARIDSDHWSVGVRGLGDNFAKSLQVLIDGRSLYTPLFAGTYWPAHDVLLEDIDRIEVIRGPGGTVWGATAVTGVINIVTLSTRDTQGAVGSVTVGSTDRGIGTFRYGGSRGSTFDYRVYAKGFARGAQSHRDDADFDEWWMSLAGARAEWRPSDRNTFTVQGDLSGGRHGQRVPRTSFVPPANLPLDGELHATGAYVRGRWERNAADSSFVRLQTYYDFTSWTAPHFEERRHTFDVDLTHAFQPIGRHAFTWGAGFRNSPATFVQMLPQLNFTPASETHRLYSAFVQDDIDLIAERLSLTAGSKIEHNQYTGAEFQPSIRLLWSPRPSEALWGSISRAVRTPSGIERRIESIGFFQQSGQLPIYLRTVGSASFGAETLIGYEAGYRTLLTPTLSVDLAAFHNHHDDLATFGQATATFPTQPIVHAVATLPYVNGAEGKSTGFELAPEWRIRPWWQLRGSYSYVQFDIEPKPGSLDAATVNRYEGSSPRHMTRLDSRLTFGEAELDLTYRYVSELPARQVEAYHTADIRAGWFVHRRLDVAVSGQNLLQPHHAEWNNPATGVSIARSVSLTATWRLPRDPRP